MQEHDEQKIIPTQRLDLDLDKIRDKQTEYLERHKKHLQIFDGITDEYLRLFLDIVNLAFNCIKEKIDEQFMYVYLIIGSRWFSHIESLTYLLYSGYYGDVVALSRMLTDNINLLTYFSYFPEDIPNWRKLADYGPRTKKEPSDIKKLRQFFLDGEVRKRLATKQLPFEGTGTLSEAIHPSEWGSQFYLRKGYDKEHTYSIQFGPQYDPTRAFQLLGLLMAFVRPPTDVFIRRCQEIGINIPGSEEILDRGNKLALKYHLHLIKFTYLLDKINEIETRVDAGEDFIKIIKEETKKFEKRGNQED